jgi:hypothetical protein
MPTIAPSAVLKAAKWIHSVAILKVAPAGGVSPGKGYATYTEFCQAMGIGDPHHNHYMDLLLLAVMEECGRRGWPDLAALVIHEVGTGQREGPGDGWYEGHQLWAGDVPRWRQHRDDCWTRAGQIAIP